MKNSLPYFLPRGSDISRIKRRNVKRQNVKQNQTSAASLDKVRRQPGRVSTG